MVARKTAAKKSAAKPLAKKVTAAKTKKSASSKPHTTEAEEISNEVKQTVALIADAIKGGDLDSEFSVLDAAITERVNYLAAEKNKTAKKVAASEKSVAPAPKKTSAAAPASAGKKVTDPKEGTTYLVSSRIKNLAGVKVKFIRFKQGDEKKCLIEVMEGKPGYPKGKRTVIPVAALEEVPVKKGPVKRKK